MDLFLNAISPYARMVRITLLEKGLAETVWLRWCDPWADDSVLGQRRQRAFQRILDQLEQELDEAQAASAITLADIAVGVALDYLTFRLPEVAWAEGRPRLAAWHGRIVHRESFMQTAFG